MNFSSFDAIVALIFSRIFGLPFVAGLNIEKAFLSTISETVIALALMVLNLER